MNASILILFLGGLVSLNPLPGSMTPEYKKALAIFDRTCGKLDASVVQIWQKEAEQLHADGVRRLAISKQLRKALKESNQFTSNNRSCIAALARLVTTQKLVPEPPLAPPPGSLEAIYQEGKKELDAKILWTKKISNDLRKLPKLHDEWRKKDRLLRLQRRLKELKLLRQSKHVPKIRLKVGSIGVFRGESRLDNYSYPNEEAPRSYCVLEISQIVDANTMFVKWDPTATVHDYGRRLDNRILIMLSKFATTGLVDGNKITVKHDELFVVSGTKTYATSVGSNTVFVVEPYVPVSSK